MIASANTDLLLTDGEIYNFKEGNCADILFALSLLEGGWEKVFVKEAEFEERLRELIKWVIELLSDTLIIIIVGVCNEFDTLKWSLIRVILFENVNSGMALHLKIR